MIARGRVVSVVLVGGALLVGCGGGGPGADKAAPGAGSKSDRIDPCAVITREDAGRLMGTSFDPGKAEQKPVVGLSLCIYHETGKGAGGALVQIGVTQHAAMPGDSRQTPEAIFRSIRSEGFPDAPALAGVGQEAFLAAPGAHILHRGVYLNVSVGLPPDRTRLEAASKLAVANLDGLLGGR